jgi:hypothetical protein
MIQCHNCGAKLKDSATECDFCNTIIVGTTVSAATGKVGQAPNWVWSAYYAISVYYIIDGLSHILTGVLPAIQGSDKGPNYISLAFGLYIAVIGFGLVTRAEFVRGLINITCFLMIFFGLIGLGLSLVGTLFLGPLGLFEAVMNAFQIATAGFMIYLIGETDRYAPNS